MTLIVILASLPFIIMYGYYLIFESSWLTKVLFFGIIFFIVYYVFFKKFPPNPNERGGSPYVE